MALPEPASSAQLPAEIEAYCVKCKATRKMADPQLVTTKNGKLAAKGKCPVCGTTMMKFLPSR
jgi:hypothetical protein